MFIGNIRKLWISIALCLAVFFVYAQVGTFEFTRHDDQYFVTENPVVLGGVSAKGVVWAFSSATTGAWMPFTWLSHMLDVEMFGLDAGRHHLTSVLLHAINSILLFFLLGRCTSNWDCSGLVAGLFALHPLHVESVAWIAERRDVLSAMWAFLTIQFYLGWLTRRTVIKYLLIMFCFAAALLTKPMAVTLPLVLLLIDVWPLNRLRLNCSGGLFKDYKQAWLLLAEKVPLFLIAFVMGVLTVFFENSYVPLGTLASYPLSLRFQNAIVSYVQYLFDFFWPVNLIVHYPYPKAIPIWQYSGAGLVVLSITIICLRNLRGKLYLAVGWFWYLLTLLPVIGLVQQGADFARADRYTYFPLIGIFVILAWGGESLAENLAWSRRTRWGVTSMLLFACGGMSYFQASHWRNTETLFSYTLSKSPGNHVALQQLGVEYRERGEFDKAYGFLAEDVRLYPENVDALANLGQLLERMGRFEEAVAYHQKAINLSPFNFELYLNLGQIKARQGDLAGAQVLLTRALELQPSSLPARINLGFVLYLRKQYDAAAEQFFSVLRREPQSADAYNGLGLVAMNQGRLDEAANNFNFALTLNPALQPARDNLLEVQKRRGHF